MEQRGKYRTLGNACAKDPAERGSRRGRESPVMLMADDFSLNGRRRYDRRHCPAASPRPKRRNPIGDPREAFNLNECRYSRSQGDSREPGAPTSRLMHRRQGLFSDRIEPYCRSRRRLVT